MPRTVAWEEWRAALDAHNAVRLRHLARQARPADVADTISGLSADDGLTVLRSLPRNAAAVVLSLLPEAARTELLDDLSDQLLGDLISHLPPDDAVDLLHELPPEQARELLKSLFQDQSASLQKLMEYREDTAGGLMTTAVIAVPTWTTVGQAIDEIRLASLEDDEFFNVYVTDRLGRLVGLVPIPSLVTHNDDVTVGTIMETDLITVRVEDDQEEVVNLCRRHDLSVIPVVSDEGRLVGRITIDDIMDAADEEAAEDMYRMAGSDPAEQESASPFRAARIRATWLLPCIAGTFLTSSTIIFFRHHIDTELAFLVLAFMPAIGAMGGNTGIQTSTRVVRALAVGGTGESRFSIALRREVPITALLSVVFGLVAGGVAGGVGYYLEGRWAVGLTVGFSMWLAIAAAMTFGVVLPFMFLHLGVDPAIASGPIITTSNDLIAVAIYLSVSAMLL